MDYDMSTITIVWEVGSCCLSLSWIWTEELSCLVGLYTPQVPISNVSKFLKFLHFADLGANMDVEFADLGANMDFMAN